MPRGGKRKNAGRKGTWLNGTTTTIRVPVSLASKVLEVAHAIDSGQEVLIEDPCRTLDLSGVPIPRSNGRSYVFLSDLIRSGYSIRPPSLATVVEREAQSLRNTSF